MMTEWVKFFFVGTNFISDNEQSIDFERFDVISIFPQQQFYLE